MPSLGAVRASLAVVASIGLVRAYPIPFNDLSGRVEVQAHRGGLGMRSEESLWAYAYAMEIGADTLEMDTVFTSDGVPVIWHDHQIVASKCKGEYVNQYIANLTLAQVKTLDCSVPLPAHLQQEIHTPTRIATLQEVIDLVHCYGDRGVTINLETKLDPTSPNQTLPVEKYVTDLIPILEQNGVLDRTYIQSFDWRTLIGIKERYPDFNRIVALLDETTVEAIEGDDPYPWLGGVDLADFDGDWVAAAASIGATVLSPVHGFPSNLTVNNENYTAFTTKEVVDNAHAHGMKVIPWTVDYEVTINKLLDDGVDSIISNYPERVMWVAKQRGLSSGRARNPSKPECLAHA